MVLARTTREIEKSTHHSSNLILLWAPKTLRLPAQGILSSKKLIIHRPTISRRRLLEGMPHRLATTRTSTDSKLVKLLSKFIPTTAILLSRTHIYRLGHKLLTRHRQATHTHRLEAMHGGQTRM